MAQDAGLPPQARGSKAVSELSRASTGSVVYPAAMALAMPTQSSLRREILARLRCAPGEAGHMELGLLVRPLQLYSEAVSRVMQLQSMGFGLRGQGSDMPNRSNQGPDSRK